LRPLWDRPVGLGCSRIACWACKLSLEARESINDLSSLECTVAAPGANLRDDFCIDKLGDSLICGRNTYSKILGNTTNGNHRGRYESI
jgi:hypothetical protein